MVLSPELEELRDATRVELDLVWDYDDEMPESRGDALAYVALLRALHRARPDALPWLLIFVARRALSCWEANTGDARLPERLEHLRTFLVDNVVPDWGLLCSPVESPFQDCRWSDTSSAADALAYAAQYIVEPDPRYAAFCISAADVAYDHILTDHHFRRWFLDVALPGSLRLRDLGDEEREAYRPRSPIQPSEGIRRAKDQG